MKFLNTLDTPKSKTFKTNERKERERCGTLKQNIDFCAVDRRTSEMISNISHPHCFKEKEKKKIQQLR
jgi:hypothetical protein